MRPRNCAAALLTVVVVLSARDLHHVAAASPASEAAADTPRDDGPMYRCDRARGDVVVSFKPRVELAELVTWAMGFTCQNFIYGAQIATLKSSVNLVAPRKMSVDQAWQTFLVALRAMKLTLVRKGAVYEIVEAAQAQRHAVPILDGERPVASEQIQRLVVRPEYIALADLKSAFEALASTSGSVTALPGSDILLVTDHGSHIARMGEILTAIDRPGPDQRLYALSIRYGDVDDIARLLGDLLAAPAVAGAKGEPTATPAAPSKIVADGRTQTLILLADQRTYERARALVDRLDSEVGADGTNHVHVYRLEHADAEATATTLRSLVDAHAPTDGARPATSPKVPAAPTSGARLEGQVRVSHDAETNSLLIMASVRDFVALRDIVRELDTPRQQVLIEATILEISMNNSSQLGLSFHGAKQRDDGTLWLTGLQHADLKSAANLEDSLSLTGALAGVIGKPLPGVESLLGQTVPSFGVLFHALAHSSQVNILSSPQLMTSNNKEATLSVGQNVPYASVMSAAGAVDAALGRVQSVQRENVDLTLKVTPHVNTSDLVRLDINLDIRELLPNQEALQPSWTTREVINTVVVRDQESIIIGGLVAEKTAKSHSKIPLLGDLPLLGRLFRRTRDESVKTNLLILLTPHVITSPQEGARLTRTFLGRRDEFLRSFSNLPQRQYEPELDYSRRRGVLAEIGAEVALSEREAEQIEALDRELSDIADGPLLPEPEQPAAPIR